MSEDLNKRLEQAAQGITPQTRPDERRRFLGSLRERCLIRIDNTEINNEELTNLFLTHLDDYQGYSILINGNISNNRFLNKLEAQASKKNIPFTLVNNETAKTGPTDTAVLVVAKDAINRMRIEISQVYAPELPKEQLTAPKKQKTSFWHRLFRGEN
ncbi:YueI family protein [Lactobacillus gigeriorum]|uniref:YueI protein n=1 Tax=Lactobacillus gigeriorum DSM 23908 = CRBIP 24.85 TaxID=1423751 RepID=I7LDC3_9LACO|nr:YueI family protein [Lactobacillus gigeriorum]KRN14754.1 hypothetical protein FC38_GL000046 [Lactobacillus gigeriorum DSM 23908 = CRBIP 24.85]CCI87216.1 YueI protein [Lactobacillus gigeriorum DSM 23908 = CRBIP 24.85]